MESNHKLPNEIVGHPKLQQMRTESSDRSTTHIAGKPPLRMWPMLVVLGLQATTLALTFTTSLSTGVRFGCMMLGPLVCLLLFCFWLLFASRLDRLSQFGILGLTILSGCAAGLLGDDKMAITLWIYGVPIAITITCLVLVLTQNGDHRFRFSVMAVAMIAMWCPFTLFRLEGFDGRYLPQLTWRWKPSHESELGFSTAPTTSKLPGVPVDADSQRVAEWPGFRGPGANGVATGPISQLDWHKAQPLEIWRRDLGPAWSSFAFASNRLFTQEQRGTTELVTCYDAGTGEPIWQYAVENRFDEVVSGAGPRATPTFAKGRIFSYGAKAVLCCLDADAGKVIWQRDLMQEINARIPIWGFTSSPVVINDKVVVYADGDESRGLCAFDVDTGASVWQIASSGMNFSSAQRFEVHGETLAVFGDSDGLRAIAPDTGRVAWQHRPSDWKGPAIVQPQQIGNGSLLVPLGDGVGLARLECTYDGGVWQIKEAWSSKSLRPSFNDFVFYEGHAYGFDKNLFACIDASTGKRRWKRGRYGFGQVVLLSNARRLIVTTEQGDAVLLEVNPDQHRELGRISAVAGKTWNHPVVVQNSLFIRNGKSVVCYGLDPTLR